MILVAIGSNLSFAGFRTPLEVAKAGLGHLESLGISVDRRSPWYRSAAFPDPSDPPFVNGVVAVATALNPSALMRLLHAVEDHFGRVRKHRNGPRTLDLDLIAYNDYVTSSLSEGSDAASSSDDAMQKLCLPHPRLQERAFVLRPLCDIAPDWRHPISGLSAAQLYDTLSDASRADTVLLT